MSNREIEETLARDRATLRNALDEADLQALLVPFGYDEGALEQGFVLLDAATSQYQKQVSEFADTEIATDELGEQVEAARAAYVRHVKLARVAFKRGTAAYVKLELEGDRGDALDVWVAQARRFYKSLDEDAVLRLALSRYTIDEAALTAARSALDAVDAARVRQLKEAGEAQEAKRERDLAVARLRGFMADFRSVARVACEGQPQLLEKLGIVVRA